MGKIRSGADIKSVLIKAFQSLLPFFYFSFLGFIKLGSKYEMASIQEGGFLKIRNIDSTRDTGLYTCIVRNRANEEARREIKLVVNSKINECGIRIIIIVFLELIS